MIFVCNGNISCTIEKYLKVQFLFECIKIQMQIYTLSLKCSNAILIKLHLNANAFAFDPESDYIVY